MEPLPWSASGATFLRSESGDVQDVRPGMVVISGAPHGVKDRMTQRGGPKSIRESSLSLDDRLSNAGSAGVVDVSTGRYLLPTTDARIMDVGDLREHPTDVVRTTESIAGGTADVTRRGGWSVCLGGDHYVGYPSCLGFCRAVADTNPRVKVGYIHIDGHLDFDDSAGTMGRYNSGTNARRISEIDVVVPSSMVWIGIQGVCSMDAVEIIRRNGATIFTSEDIHEMGPAEVGKRAVDLAIKGCDYIYLSFDIDVIDAGFSNGTGSVTMGAVTPRQLMEVLDELAEGPIGAMDLVETAPSLDPSGRTAAMASESLVRLIAPKIFDVR